MLPRLLPSSRAGTGAPLLLLHGLGTNRRDFDSVVPLLSETFDVIAVDLPGQGEARPLGDRPTVAALATALEADLDARGLDRVHVLGNSLGGRLALELARRGRARSVVAIAPSGLSNPPERVYQLTAMAMGGLAIRVVRPLMPALSRSQLARAVLLAGLRARPWRVTEDEAAALGTGLGNREFWRLLWWSTAVDVGIDVEHLDCPVVLAQGTNDWLAGGQTIRFAVMLSEPRFRLLPWAGHAAHGDLPHVVAELVRAAACTS